MKNKNYLHTWQLDNSFAFFQSLKAKSVLLGWMLLTFFISSNLLAQTTLDPGDIAIIGVNANNGACGFPTEDIISFVAFNP